MLTRATRQKRILQPLGFGFTLPLALAACGGSGGSGGGTSAPLPAPPPPPPPPQTIQGTVFDGPIEGASVFRDENGNGVQDNDEPFAVSNANGQFEIVEGTGDLVSLGGVDTITGFDFSDFQLTAPAGARVISPITTLLNNANDAGDFADKIGLSALDQLDPSFDPLTYSPFDPANAANADLNELLIFLNQGSQILVSVVRVIAEVTGQANPLAFALDLVANNAAQVPDDSVGIFTDSVVVNQLSQDLITSGVVTGRTIDEVVNALEELTSTYAILLGDNVEPGDSAAVQAIVQEAIITVESLIVDLVNDTGVLPRDYFGLFPDSFDLEQDVDALAAQLVTFGNNVFIAARSGSAISGTGQNDFIRGRLGDDDLRGGNGDDRILGEQGNDILSGGDGNDTLVKRFGSGSIDGGAGDDLIIVERAAVDIDGGPGIDTLDLEGAAPRGFFIDPPVFMIDLVDQLFRLEFEGEDIFSQTIESVEEFEFRGQIDLLFRGTDASERVDANSGLITIIPSGGNDVFTQDFVTNPLRFRLDFSAIEDPVSITFGPNAETIDYGFGSIATNSNIEWIVGTDQGDTFTLANNRGAIFLGGGQDTVILTSATVPVFVENFSASGPVQDVIDLTQLPGAEDTFVDIDAVLDSFIVTQGMNDEGETIPIANFRFVENGISTDIAFVNVALNDIGPENIILPGDVV